MQDPMRIAIIASSRHPIREPFAGGLEMHTFALATRLRSHGHEVTVFASGDSDPELGVEPVCPVASGLDLSEAARLDPSMLSERFLAEHHAYLHLMLALAEQDFDVVHNNSLHHLPIAMASLLPCPVLTTLHTPPTPWLESAVSVGSPAPNRSFVAVSATTAAQWAPRLAIRQVIHNGIDLASWGFSPQADRELAVWTGRIVPEKGPHLAIEAALAAGMRIVLAGPVGNQAYFDEHVRPHLKAGVRYAGHLPHCELAALVAGAGVLLCTPRWEEPYGLVVAEALAAGTPVAAFDRGAMRELLTDDCGRLASPDDPEDLARAALAARDLDRSACRRHAEAACSADVMVGLYEQTYLGLIAA